MNRKKIVISTMAAVAVIALWMLDKDYAEVSLLYRVLIAFGGAIISGVLTFFLFKNDSDKVDKKSGNH